MPLPKIPRKTPLEEVRFCISETGIFKTGDGEKISCSKETCKGVIKPINPSKDFPFYEIEDLQFQMKPANYFNILHYEILKDDMDFCQGIYKLCFYAAPHLPSNAYLCIGLFCVWGAQFKKMIEEHARKADEDEEAFGICENAAMFYETFHEKGYEEAVKFREGATPKVPENLTEINDIYVDFYMMMKNQFPEGDFKPFNRAARKMVRGIIETFDNVYNLDCISEDTYTFMRKYGLGGKAILEMMIIYSKMILSEEFREQAEFKVYKNNCEYIALLINDLLTFNKEIGNKGKLNMIKTFMNSEMSLEESIELIKNRINFCTVENKILAKDLLEALPDDETDVKKVVEFSQNCIDGTLYWLGAVQDWFDVKIHVFEEDLNN